VSIENAALAAAGGKRMEPLMKLIAKINTIFFLSPPSLRQQRQHTEPKEVVSVMY
jgi:hypothetical protein